MKSMTQLLLLVFFSFLYGQKSFNSILKSDNINEIETFLKTAHPDDPRRIVLKKKLIALKNSSWTKPGIGSSMPVRAIAPNTTEYYTDEEKEEFDHLMSETSEEHKEKTVQLLNALFTPNMEGETATFLFQNRTKCNIILRIQSKTEDKATLYNLAVKEGEENFITLKKGKYLIKGKVCGEIYSSEKELNKSLLIELK
ncbi:hypothetical protein EG339_23830 [Chryseobacterium bernardetii]|uniref:DUF6759 domain-containing protein n=1 Tax=Chryseobacterium bernardetii TaxID=1241978 RepID=A0A3G6THJ1_9FLAO|nr:DUF6759 domain-containing protein [Chryseobacterium bernardetii]AZB27403.1 hypothetical protein EG339_23830 [Chryseobacterium bernardetii]